MTDAYRPHGALVGACAAVDEGPRDEDCTFALWSTCKWHKGSTYDWQYQRSGAMSRCYTVRDTSNLLTGSLRVVQWRHTEGKARCAGDDGHRMCQDPSTSWHAHCDSSVASTGFRRVLSCDLLIFEEYERSQRGQAQARQRHR